MSDKKMRGFIFKSHFYVSMSSLGTFISLALALATNNSVVLTATTSCLKNISVDIIILGGTFLQHSVNIFGGIFIALTAIDMIHSIVRMVLLSLNVSYITNNRHCFSMIFLAFDLIIMFAHVGVMAGAYFINTLLGTHAYLDPNHEPALGLIKQALWFACIFSGTACVAIFGTVIISYGWLYQSKLDKEKRGTDDNDNIEMNPQCI